MLKQAQQIGGRIQALNEELKSRRATGTAGAGLVEAEVNGLGQLLRITIDPALIERRDKELIEDLIPAAVNQAQERAKELHSEAIKTVADGFNVPGLDDVLEKMKDQGDQT